MDAQVASVVGSPGDGQRKVRPKVRPARTEAGGPWSGELMEFMLETCGKVGFGSAAAERVFRDRLGPRAEAYLLDPEVCFAAAYGAAAKTLVARLLAGGRAAATRREGFESAVRELADFISERPAVARGLLAEVRVAGARAMAERRRLLGELGHSLDRAYRRDEIIAPPSSGTAIFMLGAIEEIALRFCLQGDPTGLAAMAPELAAMVEEGYSR